MKKEEIISDFLGKVVAVSQMRTFGEKVDDQTIVEKNIQHIDL